MCRGLEVSLAKLDAQVHSLQDSHRQDDEGMQAEIKASAGLGLGLGHQAEIKASALPYPSRIDACVLMLACQGEECPLMLPCACVLMLTCQGEEFPLMLPC